MQHYRLVALLITIIPILLLLNCSGPPQADFYEVDGIVSIRLYHIDLPENWQALSFINSRGYYSSGDSGDPLSFSVYFSNPGEYSLWAQTATLPEAETREYIPVTVSAGNGDIAGQMNVSSGQQNRLLWSRAESIEESGYFRVSEPGVYTFRVDAGRARNVQIHNIHLSYANSVKPAGLGLPSSLRQDLSAADLSRDIPVMLPPAWAFGTVVGLPEASNETLPSHTPNGEIRFSAVWRGENSESTPDVSAINGRTVTPEVICGGSAEELNRDEMDFGVVLQPVEIDCIQEAHSVFSQNQGPERQTRSLVFRDISADYREELKQFPAPATEPYEMAWSVPREVTESGTYKPGGFREMVEDLSDPLNSLSGTPFLSYTADLSGAAETDMELFQQMVDLTVFTPVMHLINPQVDPSDEKMLEVLFEATALRTQLFPYHYSHAHYTRQRNETLIRGFREHKNQFLYGDAFLIAPQTEASADGRTIYFPEGRHWYVFRENERYEAGQSWFVETRSGELPVFVKAGSVIPYHREMARETLDVDIYTGDAGTFRLVEDDGRTREYRSTMASRTMFRYNEVAGRQQLTIGAVQFSYEGMKSTRSYTLRFLHSPPPEDITVNNESISEGAGEGNPKWDYDEEQSLLKISLPEMDRRQKLDIVIIPEK